MADAYDCQTCGACCASPWTGEGYVYLYDLDVRRIKRAGLPMVEQVEGDGELRRKLPTRVAQNGGRVCLALEGDVGEHCSCTIYRLRPAACRKFEAGSQLCREARKRAGIARCD